MKFIHANHETVSGSRGYSLLGTFSPASPCHARGGATLFSLFIFYGGLPALPCPCPAPGADGRREVRNGTPHRESRLRAAAGALPPRRGPAPAAARCQVTTSSCVHVYDRWHEATHVCEDGEVSEGLKARARSFCCLLCRVPE